MIKSVHNNKLFLIICFSVFAVAYGLISFVNHYQLRTYALDLGMFNHALYSFAHFKKATFTLGIGGNEIPFLGTHFSPIMILYIPFYYVFGSYTLLVIQILAILFGGVAIYKYSSEIFGKNNLLPKLILIQFFSIWGIYSSLAFDFHNNVVAAMLVLWFVYYLEKRKYIQTIIFWILVLIAQENMAVWMVFIILGLMIKNRKQFKQEYLKFEVPLILASILYTILIIGFVMPSIQGVKTNMQFIRYNHIGNSISEVLLTFVQGPIYVLSLLFKNITGDPAYNGIKQELHFMVLVSGGICLLLRPAYLIMLIPIYAQKMLSNDYNLWGINMQYSIEFVPIISLAFIDFLKHVKKYKTQIAIIIMLLTIVFNIDSINHRKSKWYNKTNTIFYGKRHYNAKISVQEIKNALKVIDDSSVVSASSCLAPRLAFREKIYHFPIVKDADYIALVTNNRTAYPISSNELKSKVEELKNSLLFDVVYDNYDLLILKRKK